ncbi:luc7-like protein 3 [Neodiprion pinetum]|uniref:luc7-like protein 3 n=1 Tax=Neodiprion pinetum TaxID=441929 RepID=UPI003716B263
MEEGAQKCEEEFRKGVRREGSVEVEWENLKERVRKAVGEMEKVKVRSKEVSGWWDEECREGKRSLRESLQQFRDGKIDREVYCEEKRKYSRLCEVKRKKEREREMGNLGTKSKDRRTNLGGGKRREKEKKGDK